MNRRTTAFLPLLALVAGCATHGGLASKPQLFDGMGPHTRPVDAAAPSAQQYFDQGLTWAYAFNHDEAIRSFREAARLDPNMAMAWWGVALCNGPHINFPMMTPEQSRDASDAMRRAESLAAAARPVDRALIAALSTRYADPPPVDRRPLDLAYADAMRAVYAAHRDDADVATLYAESLMDLQPWDLWNDDGAPKGRTSEILGVLESALALNPSHPGANHLYVHALEASPHPERANAAADRLRTLVPASGHLVHMPAHIDVQVGRWAAASDQNEAAMRADAAYRRRSPRQGFYHIYMAHNPHFLAWSSMMEGRSARALEAARAAIDSVPETYGRENAAMVDGYMCIALDAMKRFGQWDDMLREPAPPEYWPAARAHWHFSRGLAFAAKGDIVAAEGAQKALRDAIARTPAEATFVISPTRDVLAVADHMLAGEIATRRGRVDEAVRELSLAVQREDALRYMETPEWAQPVRHTLGAVLLDAGRAAEAEQVYREDLRIWPENGWSLYGLAAALRAQGKAAEADAVDARFAKAWARADVTIDSTCACIPGKRAAAAR